MGTRALLVAGVLAALAAPSGRAALTPARCPVAAPPGARLDCLRLTVPESGARPGRTLALTVLRFHARAPHPAPDPILWLAGGPGGSAVLLTALPQTFSRNLAPLLARRDVIVLEQRGNLYTRPALTCRDGEADGDCLARLRRAGIDLRAYTSAASVDDAEALRRALGIRRWNVLGESYGTRVAQTYARDHPAHLRSVALDSVVPIPRDAIAAAPQTAADAFARLAAASAGRYPGLLDTLRRAAARTDGMQLLGAVLAGLYETDLIPQLPRAIAAAAAGRGDPVWTRIERLRRDIGRLLARGVNLAVTCNEQVPFSSRAAVARVASRYPETAPAFAQPHWFDLCRSLGPPRVGAVEHRPVRSAVPTLLLSGALDPVTPPTGARLAASTLAHAYAFTFPGLGHWVYPVHACPRSILLAFLDLPNRRPDATCIAAMAPVAWR